VSVLTNLAWPTSTLTFQLLKIGNAGELVKGVDVKILVPLTHILWFSREFNLLYKDRLAG